MARSVASGVEKREQSIRYRSRPALGGWGAQVCHDDKMSGVPTATGGAVISAGGPDASGGQSWAQSGPVCRCDGGLLGLQTRHGVSNGRAAPAPVAGALTSGPRSPCIACQAF